MAMLSDRMLEGIVSGGEALPADQVPRLARETHRLRREARALRKFLEARELWAEYQQEARTAPAGKPAGRTAGKQVGKPAGAAI